MAFNITVRRAVVFAILLGVLLPALGVGVYFTRVFYYNKLDQEIQRTLQHDSVVLALGVRESLWAIDSESAVALVEAVMKDSSLVSVEILDPELGQFVYRDQPERRVGKIYRVESPVLHRGEVIGHVKLELSDELFTTEFRHQLISQVSALALQLVFSTLLILAVLQNRVGSPLKRLSQEAKLLANGELNSSIVPLRQDEIGEVESQLELTRHALQKLFQTLEQKNRTLEVDLSERLRVESALRDREQRLRTLVDQSPLAVIEFDLSWHILDWNEAAIQIFGWHREEVLGRSISILRLDPSPIALDSPPAFSQEKQRNKRADGNHIICQWYNGVIRDSGGQAQRIVAMVEDITERQQADDEIRRLATVVRMTTNLVALASASGHIVWFNRAFGDRYVAPGNDPLGVALVELLGGKLIAESDMRFLPIFQAIDSGNNQYVSELPCLSPTGNPYWVSIELQPIYGEQGQLQQWVVVMTDVTDRHTVAEALRNIAHIGVSHDTRLFLEQIQAVVARGTGASGAYIALHEESTINVYSTWGLSIPGVSPGVYPKEHSIARFIETSGALLVTRNVSDYFDQGTIQEETFACEALIAEPLFDAHHTIVGHLSLFFRVCPRNIEEAQSLAEIGASRAGAELSRQRALEALQYSEQRFSSIFQSSPIPLALFRCADTHCVDLNPAFQQAFGDLDMDPNLPNHAKDSEFQTWLGEILQRSSESATSDMRLITENGEQRDCQVIARRVTINEEESQLIAVVDVTQLLEAQRQIKELNLSLELRVKARTYDLAEANAELEQTLERLKRTLDDLVRSEKLAALGSLVAGIAHELNTPIGNGLIVASTLRDINREFRHQIQGGLRRSALDNYVQETDAAADILIRNLHRAAELISSFKQVAVDQTSSQRRSFDLAEVVNEIVVTMQPVLKRTQYSVIVQIPSPLLLDSFPGPLGQVVANLLNNAILHAFDGRPEGTITVQAYLPDPEHVCLRFEDNGTGISTDNLKRIFDPFFTTKLGRKGTGLGLNIVHNIVTSILGGTIAVESMEGKGTCFLMTIPISAPTE